MHSLRASRLLLISAPSNLETKSQPTSMLPGRSDSGHTPCLPVVVGGVGGALAAGQIDERELADAAQEEAADEHQQQQMPRKCSQFGLLLLFADLLRRNLAFTLAMRTEMDDTRSEADLQNGVRARRIRVGARDTGRTEPRKSQGGFRANCKAAMSTHRAALPVAIAFSIWSTLDTCCS